MAKKKNIFKELKDTWQDKYKINVIGIPSQIDDFIKYCDKSNIHHSKPQYFYCKSRKIKIVLFSKKMRYKIEHIAKDYNKISINADIITAKRRL